MTPHEALAQIHERLPPQASVTIHYTSITSSRPQWVTPQVREQWRVSVRFTDAGVTYLKSSFGRSLESAVSAAIARLEAWRRQMVP